MHTVGTHLHHANITQKNKATSQGGKINYQTPKATDVRKVSEKHKISVLFKNGLLYRHIYFISFIKI